MTTMGERFDELFVVPDTATKSISLWDDASPDEIKDFIRSECARATKEKDKKIKELVEALDHMQHLHDLRVADVNMLKEKRVLDAGVISELKEALECLLGMYDKEKPRKLDEALTWIANDELAVSKAIAVLAKLK